MSTFVVTHTPGLMDPAALASGPPLLRTATEAAARVVQEAVAAESPRGIEKTWHVQHLPGAGPLAWAVLTPHPGAGPLNFSAHWPNRMPPWGPDTPLATWAQAHGLRPFLVARALQRRGGFAAQWGGRYEDFVRRGMERARPQVERIVYRQGLKLWLERIGRG